ncbi:MAG: response regulator [Spirochaeta sp.]|nr:response regulator [Spirochaeta sp.]
MKILIADDEELVQYSLKSMILELGIPNHDIHLAGDGVELINALQGFSPEIAFVDIKMPRQGQPLFSIMLADMLKFPFLPSGSIP